MRIRALAYLGAAASALLLMTCADDEPQAMASARIVANRADLIGGNRALGEVGDFLLENDRIRVVVQGAGYSRGFGVFGGNLIDADLRRPSETTDSRGGSGGDSFGELFPSFFLQAVATDAVAIENDGSDGSAARIRVSGYGGDFLTLVGLLNRAAIGSHDEYTEPDSEPRLRYENIYELAPGEDWVTIRFRVTNLASGPVTFPSAESRALLLLLGLDPEGFTIPIGDIGLFGDTSPVFAPGHGFDLRGALDEAYTRDIDWPAFPGFVTEWLATRGDRADVSYGFLAGASDDNYALSKSSFYDDGRTPITRSSLMIPFVATSLMGIFHTNAPAELGPNESFEIVRYFIVGSGDVGSVLDSIHRIQGTTVGRIGGIVRDTVSGQPAAGASAIVYQVIEGQEPRPFSQYNVREGGHFGGTLPPGRYAVRVTGEARPLSDPVEFTIQAGETTPLRLTARTPGRIVATVVDEDGRRLPAKVTVVGAYGPEHAGANPRNFLFNLEAGEAFRWTDLERDDPNDAETRRYVEAATPTDRGTAELLVRPGVYSVYISRGPEYEVVRGEVDVAEGETVSTAATLHRIIDTRGWIAGDFHIHSQNSVDSGQDLDELSRWIAAEGVEWAVSTDHNYLTDLGPVVARNDLVDWVQTTVGVELSTLESGHFNGYPLRYDPGPITHGSFEWSRRTPQEIFDDLRALGSLTPEQTIVQVNHPRDTVQGYFEQYRRDALTAEWLPSGPLDFVASNGPAFVDEEGETTFSTDFDAVELLTGKRTDYLHHYRIPAVLPPGEVPEDAPPAGTILLDSDDEVAFPGAVDDWYNFLNLGYRWIAVGNSDSHEHPEELGFPRNMVYVGDDVPHALSEAELVAAVRSRRVFVTTGPMLDMSVNDPVDGAMGQTIVPVDTTVWVTVRLTAAPWVDVSRINIVRNGMVVEVVEVPEALDLANEPFETTLEIELARNAEGNAIDSWFVAEAIGYESMFPMVLPLEVPPLVLSDAVASLGSSLGFGSEDYGVLAPPRTFPITAYAITNPVWVDRNGDGFDAPGVAPLEEREGPGQDPGLVLPPGTRMTDGTSPDDVRWVGRATPIREGRPLPLLARDPNDPYDVRRVFDSFRHAH